MRHAQAAALLLASTLGGCATSDVLLLPGENGASAGAVAVLDERRGGDAALLDSANEKAALSSGRVRPRAVKPERIARRDLRLLEDLPPPASRFMLNFIEGSSRLMPESADDLNRLFAEVRRRDGADVVVIGYTDTLGAGEDNDRLSRERAEEIRTLLVSQGLDPAATVAVGRGERDPLVDTGDGVRRAENRRVEVVVR